jgi:hypothetical protein
MRRALPKNFLNISILLTASFALGGCMQAELDSTQSKLTIMSERMDALSAQLTESQAALETMQTSDEVSRQVLEARIAALDAQLQSLPSKLELTCPDAPEQAQCEEVSRVVVSADKMLVGELEYVYVDPPGINVVARIDTGATSSSLHAENLVPFERDGEDWIRFDMMVSESDSVSIERQVLRHVRVVQQADPSGSRRPVVAMRVRLGEIQDTFEFTLANRSHLENELILGRNFLADVTLVDVGQQFIQPRYSPADAQ